MQIELNDMMKAYSKFQGNPNDQRVIQQTINEINPEVEQLKRDEAQAYQFLQGTLESWT